MKKYLILILILSSISCYSQDTSEWHYKPEDLLLNNTAFGYQAAQWITYAICIGNGAGRALTNEAYCVIVGHDSIARTIHGKDMLWYVDWEEPYLINNPYVYREIKRYSKIVNTKHDTKEARKALGERVSQILYIR